MARVQLENVKKIYQGNVTAVHDFNLDIADKEFVVFVGPSGCGKSTTLRMVAGLEEISEGSLKIDGEVVNDLQPKDRGISMVFQNYALYPHLTVYENMAFPLRISKVPYKVEKTAEEKAEIEKKIAAVEENIKKFEDALRDTALVNKCEAEVEEKVAAIQLKIDANQAKIVELQKQKECLEVVEAAKVELAGFEKEAAELRPIAYGDDSVAAETKREAKAKLRHAEKMIEKTRNKAEHPIPEGKANRINETIQNLSFKNAELKEMQKDVRNNISIQAQYDLLIKAKKDLEEDLKNPTIKYKKMDANEIYKRVTNAANILGITEYLNRKPRALSGGQRQRVAIGRAMVKDCKVFLMDEPLSNLDAKLRNQMRAEIILLRKKIQTTFIYVTHDQTEAMTLGDRIVIMKAGYIMQVGTPEQVFDHPDNLFVAEFIGAPKMNTFKAQLNVNNGVYSVTAFGKELPLDGPKGKALAKNKVQAGEVILGVRPEHVGVVKTGGIPTTIQVNEMMGSEVHLHVVTDDGTSLVVRVPTVGLTEKERADMIPGAKVNISFEDKVMHFFDVKTEESLTKEKK